ncbi:AMP-binding protein [Ruminococcaceae bacterium OttesenSCG-928-L11]|nr:AMP-binding protein [Ruminococcaceae bacterium OttesenSCG-928-L11]
MFPDRPAVKYIDRPYERTWKEFNEECNRVAKGLIRMGVKKGDHVAIWATNVPEWLITMFASAKIGAVLVTVNTNYKVFELQYLLKQSDSKVLVMTSGFKDVDYVKTIYKLFPDLPTYAPGTYYNEEFPHLQSFVYIGESTPAGMYHFDDLQGLGGYISDKQLELVGESLRHSDVVNMQYTSGTTGFPKGVMLTHYNIVNNGFSIGNCMKLTEEDRFCIPVPFFHCFGVVLSIMACVTHGSSMVPLEYYNPIKFLQACQDEDCTAVNGVPTMFIAAFEHPDFPKYKFRRLRTGIMAGSPCPAKVMQLVVDKMGMKDITIVFGQTESSPGCTQTRADDPVDVRVNTVGRPLPGVECRIVDPETGKEVGIGEQGEFCARGYNLMRGYYKMEEATHAAIDEDGWLHTGDLATVDADGNYRITGRIKDMIIRGGENIYPKELEELLYTHPKVKDVQVVGVPSEAYGEEVTACIVLRDFVKECTDTEIKDFVRENMARHKVPSYVAFMEEFPMTASGKIQKYKLRDWAVEKFGLDTARKKKNSQTA